MRRPAGSAYPFRIRRWNATAAAYPRDASLVELFGRYRRETPHALAVVAGDTILTYEELDGRANAVACALADHGVGTGDRVGLLGRRGADAIVAILGVLKAGAVYVPLDSDHPRARLEAMAEDTGVEVLIALPGAGRPLGGGTVLRVDERTEARPPDPARPATGSDLACVLFTSGTMGRPKAVGVRQRGITRLVVGTDYIEFTPGDRVLQSSPLTFDLAPFQIWGALLNGARVVVADSRVLVAPDALSAVLEEHGVTVVSIATAVFHQLASRRPGLFSGVRDLLFGGERLDPQLVRRVLHHGPPQRLTHVYGPTENTTFTTCYLLEGLPADAATVPVGRPIANTTCHILREDGTPAEVGEQGEVFAGGDGVAAGYLNDPALTADRFVPDPFADDPAARLYRTGDIASWREDGNVEFHGRRDGQFKIQGHRVEASEIETALRGHPAVADAAVIREEMGSITGEARLVAHLVRTDGHRRPGEPELRRFLGGTLPFHMIPAVFRWLDRLPLNPHGKVDRAALSLPEEPQPASPVTAPTLLDRVRGVWQEALRERGVDQEIEPEHSLFDAGGTSLDALRIHERVTAVWHVPDLTPLDLFTYPTLRGYSEHLGSLLGSPEAAADPDRPPGHRGDGPRYRTP